MSTAIKWTPCLSGGVETTIAGFRVSRTTTQSGKQLYWVHWFENAHYAAPHSRMSVAPHRSLQSARAMVAFLQSQPLRYFTAEQLRAVQADLARIDQQFPEYCEQWHQARSKYTAQFKAGA